MAGSVHKTAAVVSILLFLVAGIGIFLLTGRAAPTVVTTNLENIPMNIQGYSAVEDFFPAAVYEELNADKHVYRHYLHPGKNGIDLYIGYYGTAKGGRTPHNPYACLPSQGWLIVDAGKVFIKSELFPDGTHVNYMVSKQEELYMYILHWYQSAGTKVLDTGIKQNIHRFVNKTLYNRNDGAYIQLSQTIEQAHLESAKNSLSSFAAVILDSLPEYWPVEQ
ncbi:MAG: EpsI family protein [Desulfobulbaceae bacterium]|nr:EpsI family protein [Desulfobulbaceae bacterium]